MSVVEGAVFEDAVRLYLTSEDDPKFWASVFSTLTHEFEAIYSHVPKKYEIFFQIGACSHWLRPHQTRLTAAGGFANPTGYLGGGFSWDGLPEFDWFVIFSYEQADGGWVRTDKFFGKRKLVCRIALPTRTLRHDQAAINVLWSPGTPNYPGKKLSMYYGFRKVDSAWKCVASGEL